MVWAMPETALGFFPGACDVKPTTPGKVTYTTSKRDLEDQFKTPALDAAVGGSSLHAHAHTITDVGSSWVLPRLPHCVGRYLALTG